MSKKRFSLSQKLRAWEERSAERQKASKNNALLGATEKRADDQRREFEMLISDQDRDLFLFPLRLSKCGYLETYFRENGHRIYIFAHQIIANRMGLYPCECIDHINGNRADCRRENIRAASASVNQRNLHKSGFVGVKSSRNGRRWRARICMGGRSNKLQFYSACYDTKERAAFAYNQMAQLFGFRTRNQVNIPSE